MIVLVINCGSSSLRVQVIETENGRVLFKGIVQRIGAVSSLVEIKDAHGQAQRENITADNHNDALRYILDCLRSEDFRASTEFMEIGAVGHRVVHGGEAFNHSVVIDEWVIKSIKETFDLAPLHNPANLEGIYAAQALLPEVPHVAVFDTAFHQTLPEKAYLYAIPYRLYRRHKVRKYGFHGTSHLYVSRRFFEISGLEKAGSRLITCHLGNGCSVTAIHNGRSVDTSMGLTPLSGLVMGTRCGDIDPAVVFYLMEKEEMGPQEVHSLLNRHSGLVGLSEYDSDMSVLTEKAAQGDQGCQRAIDVFSYHVRCYIGQFTAVMNGCDALVFTAGIGENSPHVRSEICSGLSEFGIEIDPDRNNYATGSEHKISTDESRVEVWTIPTNEELVIAQDAMQLVETSRNDKS